MPSIKPFKNYKEYQAKLDDEVGEFMGFRIFRKRELPHYYYAIYIPDAPFAKKMVTNVYPTIEKLRWRIVEIRDDMDYNIGRARDKTMAMQRYASYFHDDKTSIPSPEYIDAGDNDKLFGELMNLPRPPKPRVGIEPNGKDEYEDVSWLNQRLPRMREVLADAEDDVLDEYPSCNKIDKRGNTMLRKRGGSKPVIELEQSDIPVMQKPGIFMRNERGSIDRMEGSSFKAGDIAMAATYNMPEYRMVTSYGSFVLRPPKSGWPPAWELSEAYMKYANEYAEDYRGEIAELKNEYYQYRARREVSAMAAPDDVAYRKYTDKIMRSVARDYGLEYTFEPRWRSRKGNPL